MSLRNARIQDGIAIAELHGSLKGPSQTDAEAGLQKILREGCSKLVLDLRRLDELDSACLSLLVSSGSTVGRGRMRLVVTSGMAWRILRLTRLDKILPVDDSVEAAIAALS